MHILWHTAYVSSECWFRNPHGYIKECAEMLVPNIVWDRGSLFKYRIDPTRHIELYYPSELDYRILAIGAQGAAELRRGRPMTRPVAVYPVWCYGLDSLEVLEEMLAEPIGLSESACRDSKGTADERPVLGQEHRVVITGMPNARTGEGRKIITLLSDLQQEYPDAIMHYHGGTTFRVAFGLGFRAGDIDPRMTASKGSIMLANNKMIKFEEAHKWPQWIKLGGMKPSDLTVPRNRCMFNITSALWAAENWDKNLKFAVTRGHELEVKHAYSGVTPVNGDRFHCDTCSLQTTCKYYRHEGVCSVPDSEPATLVQFFKTRDSDKIIDGLGMLLAIQTRRLEDGLASESLMGLDPEVSKIINSLYDQGIKLAKLVNPALAAAGATRVAVQVNNNQTALPSGNVNALISGVVADFEANGIPRKNITVEMMTAALLGPQKAIDVGEADVA